MARSSVLLVCAAITCLPLAAQHPGPIPRPTRIQLGTGTFTIPDTVQVAVERPTPRLGEIAELLVTALVRDGFPARITAPNSATVLLRGGGSGTDESYHLEVGADRIVIEAPADAGVLWGVQTLRQLWTPGVRAIATQVIDDASRYSWRGSMLDVGRHVFPVDYILKHLEWMSLHKLNVFRWHLTEDQGWRIEIDAYPRLTAVGAWRTEADGSRYGGFYTKAEVRRVVEHARRLGITVVPEIEMPGHARAALAAYPHLGCTGDTLPVPHTWGVFTDVMCPGKESTFEFIEKVLAEVLELFPSHYIHIGGDEVPKERWKNCEACQEIIRREQLGDEHGLQRWMIARVGRWLAAHGRQMIGWDEIIDGGLPDNATVQAWQSADRISAAMQLGADVIASPNEWLYLNGSAGNLPLGRVASFDPAAFTAGAGGRGRLLGIEAPLWTEHVTSPVNAELMWWPRLLAVAEVAWSGPADTVEFAPRVAAAVERLRAAGVAVGPADRGLMSLSFGYDSVTGTLRVRQQVVDTMLQVVATAADGAEQVLRDGDPMPGTGSWQLSARWGGQSVGESRSITMVDHLAVGKPITLATPADHRYPGTGPYTLVDGARGASFNDGFWNGWWGPNVEATIDLERVTQVSSVSVSLLEQVNSWILYPRQVLVSGSSDGDTWTSLGMVQLQADFGPDDSSRDLVTVELPAGTAARWLRVVVHGGRLLPPWHPGAGNPAWVFADEIVVR